MAPEDGYNFVEKVCNIYKNKAKSFLTDPIYATVPNRHKALGIGFALSYLTAFKLSNMSQEERVKFAQEMLNDLIPILNWLTGIGSSNRDYLDYYYFYSALFLQVITRFVYEAGHINKQLIKLIDEVLSEDMVGSWSGNRQMNIVYLSNIILALANIALKIPMKNAKSNLLMRLTSYLETLASLYASDMEAVSLFIKLALVRIYMLSESENGIARGRRIIEELKKMASPFMNTFLEKITVSAN